MKTEECPKCGESTVYVKYHEKCKKGKNNFSASLEEHLHNTCSNCKYDWITKIDPNGV